MGKLISCEFNMDTACVELRYTDGILISIDCTTAIQIRTGIVLYGFFHIIQGDGSGAVLVVEGRSQRHRSAFCGGTVGVRPACGIYVARR